MNQLYDMHCHMGFAPSPIATAQEGAAAGIGAFSCTVAPDEYERLLPILADAPNVALGLGARSGSTSRGRAIRKRAASGRRAPSRAFSLLAISP